MSTSATTSDYLEIQILKINKTNEYSKIVIQIALIRLKAPKIHFFEIITVNPLI